jgi:diguanylate cyclase (GGDEF)-like protein
MNTDTPRTKRLRVGVLILEIDGEFFRPLADGVRRQAVALDADLVFFPGHLPGSPFQFWEQWNAAYELVDSDVIDGLVVFAAPLQAHLDEPGLRRFLSNFEHLPMVCVGFECDTSPAVMLDNFSGFKELVRHFIVEHGHTRIAMMEGPPENGDAQERLVAYLEAHAEAGLVPDPRLRVQGDFTQRKTPEAMAELWSRGVPFSAIVCANDEMAHGVMAEAVSRGIEVPRQLAVGGFDDLLSIQKSGPALTTVNQALDTQGAKALSLLVALTNDVPVAACTSIPTRLVVRSSCGCHGNATLSERAALIEDHARQLASTETPHAMVRALRRDFAGLREAIREMEVIQNLRQVRQLAATRGFRSEFKERVTTDDLDDLLAALAEGLNRLGLGTCFVALYRESLTLEQMRTEGMPSSSKLVLAMHEGRLLADWLDVDFATCRLLPHELPAGVEPQELVVLPLFWVREHFGFAIVSRPAEDAVRCEELRHELSTYIHHCLLVRDLARARDMLRSDLARAQRDNEALSHLAMRDELTQLLNRRGFFQLAEAMLSTARLTNKPVTLIFADLDGLKQINDTHGHEEGDVAIKESARILGDTFRQDDVVSRIGGDEFVVLTRIQNLHGLPEIERRLTKAFDEYNQTSGKPYSVGCSLGGYVISLDSRENLDDVLAQADRLLYAAKRRKRAQREGRASRF